MIRPKAVRPEGRRRPNHGSKQVCPDGAAPYRMGRQCQMDKIAEYPACSRFPLLTIRKRKQGPWAAFGFGSTGAPHSCRYPCPAARTTPQAMCAPIAPVGRCPALPVGKANGWWAGSWRNAPAAKPPCRSTPPIAAGPALAPPSGHWNSCRPPDQASRALSAAFQASIWLSSTVRGTAPCASTAS